MNLEPFGDRLRDERKRLGLDQRAMAQAAGVSRNSQVAYEGGKTAPPVDYLFAIEELGVDLNVLFGGHGDAPVKTDFIARRVAEGVEAGEPPIGSAVSSTVLLPEIDIGYSMGGGLVIQDHAEAVAVPFPKNWLRPLIKGSFEQLFIARGEGDSMQPTLLDGDIVIIDTAQNAINSQDRLWCITYGDLGMIKRVRTLPDGGIDIISDNPAIRSFKAYDGEVQIIGRVVWIGRKA